MTKCCQLLGVIMVIIIKRKLCYHMCYRNVKIRTFFLKGTQLSTLSFIPGKDSPREYPSLPSPRRISNELFSSKGRKLFSYRNTVQLMAWGQFLAHDCVATPADSGKSNIYRTALAKFEDTTGEIRSCNSKKN